MSLISTASPWISGDDSQKKRTPTMRKTIKKLPPPSPPQTSSMDEPSTYVSHDSTWSNISTMKTPHYQDTNTAHNGDMMGTNDTDHRPERINELINQMNAINIESDGRHLADFKPLSHPAVSSKKPENRIDHEMINPPVYFPLSEHNHTISPSGQGDTRNGSLQQPTFSANNIHQDKNSDYRMVYQPPTKLPSYGGSPPGFKNDDRLMDRINYMIHLLEEQANEKTNNVMEEFVMFSLVGVFLIYVLDSFSRSGRYTR